MILRQLTSISVLENTKSIFQYKQKQISLHNLFLFSSPNKTYNLLGDSTLGGSSEMIQVNLEIKFQVLIRLIIQLNTIQVNLGWGFVNVLFWKQNVIKPPSPDFAGSRSFSTLFMYLSFYLSLANKLKHRCQIYSAIDRTKNVKQVLDIKMKLLKWNVTLRRCVQCSHSKNWTVHEQRQQLHKRIRRLYVTFEVNS